MTIISLGGNCSVAYQLKRYKSSETYPFDWCSITIKELCQVLDNIFEDFHKIWIKKFSENHIKLSSNEGTFILKNKYNITFAHEVINKNTIDEFSELLFKRVQRFKKVKNPTFIRIEINNLSNLKMKLYLHLIDTLEKYFENFKLIVISKFPPPFHSKIHHIKLDDFSSNWKYSNVNWEKIFKTI